MYLFIPPIPFPSHPKLFHTIRKSIPPHPNSTQERETLPKRKVLTTYKKDFLFLCFDFFEARINLSDILQKKKFRLTPFFEFLSRFPKRIDSQRKERKRENLTLY